MRTKYSEEMVATVERHLKTERVIKGLFECNNNNPKATCDNCPYKKYNNCTERLIADCGEYIAELQEAGK